MESIKSFPKNPIRLSALNGMIRDAVTNAFAGQTFWVLADVVGHKFYPEKQLHFFELVEKDETRLLASIRGNAWGDGHKSIMEFEKITGQTFTSGIHVLVQVMVDFHILYGLKLQVLSVDTSFTLGELEKKKQETLQQLLTECSDFIRKDGDLIITRNKGLRFRQVIQMIAVVSSKQSAGYEDFMHTLKTNTRGYKFTIDSYYSPVQGESKWKEVYDQLINVFQSGKKYDAVVIIRGGGAETDFLIFNEFILGKIVAKFPIPIITGIGHQKDQSIVDMMAHTETKTPTKAAEFIIAHNRMFEDRILSLEKGMVIRSQQMIAKYISHVSSAHATIVNLSGKILNLQKDAIVQLQGKLVRQSNNLLRSAQHQLVSTTSVLMTQPKWQIQKRKQDMIQLSINLNTFTLQMLKNRQSDLKNISSLIHFASPEQTLKRGFAMIMKEDKVLNGSSAIHKGDRITIKLHDASIEASVTEKKLNGSENNI